MNEKHPCDLCDIDCFNANCPLHDLLANYCHNYDCMFQREDSCILGIRCGASGQLETIDEEIDDE